MTEETTTDIAEGTTDWVPRDGDAPAAQRLLSGDGLTLVRFSFRAGQVLDEHRAAGPIIIQCLRGVLDLAVDTGSGRAAYRLTAGTAIPVAARLTHRLEATEDAVVQVVLHRALREADAS